MFRSFESSDPELLAGGVHNLELLLDEVDLHADLDDRTWQLSPLTEADLDGLTVPDRDPSALGSLALANASRFPPAAHATHMVQTDLVPVGFEADVWARSFREPSDPACFPTQDCPVLRTDNHAELDNTWVTLAWDTPVDYRWVRLADGRDAIVSRGWFEQSSHGNADANHIWQRYEVDVLAPDDEGGAWHFYGTWSETEFAVVSDDFVWAENLRTAVAVFDGQEAWLEANER